MSFKAEDWFNSINCGNVLISYQGEVSSELITSSLEVVESKLDESNEDSKMKKKVYNVLVELLQNLFHHSESVKGVCGNDQAMKYAVFVVSKPGEELYSIYTGNFVKNSRIQFLTDRVEQLNAMNVEELKELYKMILNNEEFSDKGGGGLGMIDVARKTGAKMDYSFQEFSDEFSFFCLNININ